MAQGLTERFKKSVLIQGDTAMVRNINFNESLQRERCDSQEEQCWQSRALLLLPIVEVVLSNLLVGVCAGEPELHAFPRGFGVCGIDVRVGPDFFTHGFGCGKNISPLTALATFRTFVDTCDRIEYI